MDWMFVSPSDSYVDILTPTVAIFPDESSKEVIKVKLSQRVGTLIQ